MVHSGTTLQTSDVLPHCFEKEEAFSLQPVQISKICLVLCTLLNLNVKQAIQGQ